MTRLPNPPKVLLRGLTEEQQRKVILLALEVVSELSVGSEWGALQAVEMANLDVEEKLAFGSLLNSKQAATMVSLYEAAYDKKEYKDV